MPQPDLRALSMRCTATLDGLKAEGDKPARPTFAIHGYSGGLIRVAGFWSPVVIDLAGLRKSERVAVLLDHDPRQIVGQANKVKIGAKSIDLSGVVTGNAEDPSDPAGKVVMHARGGFEWNASVGVIDIAKLEYVEANVKAKVNGQSFTGPLYIVRQGRLDEVSFVSSGADETAFAKVAASSARDRSSAMDFQTWLKAAGFDPAEVEKNEKQRDTLERQFRAEVKAEGGGDSDTTPEPATSGKSRKVKAASATAVATDSEDDDAPDPVTAMRAKAAAESKRIAAIHAAAKGNAEIEAKAISEGWTAEKTELEVLRAGMPKTTGIRAGHSDDLIGQDGKAVEAALCLSAGLPEAKVAKWYGEKAMDQASGRDLRGCSLQTVAGMICARAGMHVPSGRLRSEDYETVLRANARLRAQSEIRAEGGFSIVSLTGILGNVANKAMLSRFEALPSIVPDVAAETDTNDFKAFTRYRLDGTGELKTLNAAGELEHVGLTESSFSNQLITKGGIIALTRQMLINDDLNAFLQIPGIFGELSAHTREKLVSEKILSNTGSFFQASVNPKNYASGAGSALSSASLAAAIKLFREMMTAGSKFANLMRADRVLIPPAVEGIANELFKSQYVHPLPASSSGTSAAQKAPTANIYQGMFRPVVGVYLGTAAGLTNGSDTGWYLLSPPTESSAIVQVGYLRGMRTPTIESADTDFNTLGMQWRCYWDLGVAYFEPRAGVFSAGA